MNRSEALCEVQRIGLGAIDNNELADAMITQIRCRQLTHFSRAYQQDRGFMKVMEKPLGKLHRHITNRGGITADTCFAACALSGYQCSTEQCRCNRSGITTALGKFQSLCNLPLNLRLTRHQGI